MAASLILVEIPTAAGVFTAYFSGHGLARLDFPSRAQRRSSECVQTQAPPQIEGWKQATARAVSAILNGKNPALLPPLDLSVGTSFQQRVWAALRRIERGQTQTYAEVASAIGSPKATRAVGAACGANPIPLLVPCHRVLASGGRLGGFSGGLDWKQRLLAAEGIVTGALLLP